MTQARLPSLLALAAAATMLSACSTMTPASRYSQDSLPDSIKVPAGNVVAMETRATGELTYECKDKAAMPGQLEWTFVGPKATLADRAGKAVGTYYGPPATWQAADGSKVSGTQLAVAPSGPGNIPFQLVKVNPVNPANPASGAGAMLGTTYIQRVALQGGAAPASGCSADTRGQRTVVNYQADYIFWKAM
ncbi:DUF3455 domain-containing protein [Massilia sp. DWR3-1-1]|uniref:DUF3455 domain-containing protein n=1 Tax=Massilia sp. DWR3-1-1 TaxID=2804559 RepID=UPI003CEE8353